MKKDEKLEIINKKENLGITLVALVVSTKCR